MESHQQKFIFSSTLLSVPSLYCYAFLAALRFDMKQKCLTMIFHYFSRKVRTTSEHKKKENEGKTQTTIKFALEFFSALFVRLFVNGWKRYFRHFLISLPNLAFKVAPVKSFHPINYNPEPLAMEIGGEALWNTQNPSNKRKSLRNRKQKCTLFWIESLID